MIKLLIVDDEQIEREGMAAILRSKFPDMELMQAKNGKLAVELVPQFRPDLVLMDIKMPGMNGLEAIERIGADYPATKFIMVTAYDTFEYARSAIKLGVKDYLLKPSKASEIQETVARVVKEIEEERSDSQLRIRERNAIERMLSVVEADVVTQLLFDHVHEVHLNELVGLLGGDTTGEAFVLVIRIEGGAAAESFYGTVKEKVRRMANGWVGAMSGRQIPIVIFLEAGKSYRAQAASTVRQLLGLLDSSHGLNGFIGVGSPYASLEHIRFSYQEALTATSDTSLPARYRLYEDLPSGTGTGANDPAAQRRERQLADQIRFGRWDEAWETIRQAIEQSERSGLNIHRAQQRALESIWLSFRVLTEMGIETEPPYFSFRIEDYRQLRTEAECLLKKLRQEAEKYKNRLEPDAIHRIKQYIAQNSHRDISLETIAQEAGMSPFYISKSFKEQFGVNYIDYLTECRVERAKALLSDGERSLKEIAYEVGYRDPNYFSKVFKKCCGTSPTDYRKALIGKKG
jgi:two-component system response regulator YesN